MNKKTILIFSLIFSILTLLYLISDYYGGNRYIVLHVNDSDKYIKNYTKLEKACKGRVVVCFSNNDPDLKGINPFLNSILDQTVRIDEIMLITPYSNIGKIPEKYKKVLSVHGYKKNYDNAANLICSVLTEPDANTKIIIVDSNIVYPQDFIQTLVTESDKNPNKIIYGSPTKETKYGILIKPAFFDDKISKYEEGCSKDSCYQWLNKCTNTSSTVADCGIYYPLWK